MDAMASSTTTDAAYTRNPLAPFGLRAAWPICRVTIARQCYGIACAMPPHIWHHGACNAVIPFLPRRLLEVDCAFIPRLDPSCYV